MASPGILPLTRCRQHEKEIIESFILSNTVSNGDLVEILEAGCGRQWPLDLRELKYRLTGIDMDDAALSLRKHQQKDLDVAIVGDLRTTQLEQHSFDVIYSSFVLEHIAGAEDVLKNFYQWLKPSGIIILKIPDPESVQGWVARNTPHWFHVFYYRYVLRSKNAGKKGFAPYPVQYDPIVSLHGIRNFCAAHQLIVLAEYGDGYLQPGRGMMKLLVSVCKHSVGLLSLGKLSVRHSNILLILQKPEQFQT